MGDIMEPVLVLGYAVHNHGVGKRPQAQTAGRLTIEQVNQLPSAVRYDGKFYNVGKTRTVLAGQSFWRARFTGPFMDAFKETKGQKILFKIEGYDISVLGQ